MDPYSPIEIFTLIFITMGPIKPLITFAEKSSGLDSALRRRIAVRAVTIATITGLLFIFFGNVFMELFKFSSTAMTIAGGLILLIYAIRSILKEPKPGGQKGYSTDREAEQMAIYPIAVPLMASPMGLVTLTVISANSAITAEEIGVLTLMLLIVMAVNLVALLTVDLISKYLSVEALEVGNRILGILLAALAVETLINGGAQLLQEVGSKLRQ